MNVRELLEHLSEADPDTEVVFAYDFGDHWHTQVAATIDDSQMTPVVWSDYHGMGKLALDEYGDPLYGDGLAEKHGEDFKMVLVLR